MTLPLLTTGFILATVVATAAAGAGPFDAYRDKARVLAVVAPSASDPRLVLQRKLYHVMGAGARERDLVLVEGIGPGATAAAMRRRFGLAGGEFRVVLVGKDGGDKLISDAPLGPDRLYPVIDAMPMRQEEMQRRRR